LHSLKWSCAPYLSLNQHWCSLLCHGDHLLYALRKTPITSTG
jgi:hypothetical protein